MIENRVFDNGGIGLDLGASTTIINKTGGTVSGGVEIGTNLGDGNTTCP